VVPWPVGDNEFDAVHAYQVLEHVGAQGDVASFFATFGEIWRVLKPGGELFASVPSWKSVWAWGDPSHKRIISPGSIQFLSQEEYHNQIGRTSMSDFRHIWDKDFEVLHSQDDGDDHIFVLRAHKPARRFDYMPNPPRVEGAEH
jgi:predicted SAM-dependent methyltransferase